MRAEFELKLTQCTEVPAKLINNKQNIIVVGVVQYL